MVALFVYFFFNGGCQNCKKTKKICLWLAQLQNRLLEIQKKKSDKKYVGQEVGISSTLSATWVPGTTPHRWLMERARHQGLGEDFGSGARDGCVYVTSMI